jgi:hypothetical protein
MIGIVKKNGVMLVDFAMLSNLSFILGTRMKAPAADC